MYRQVSHDSCHLSFFFFLVFVEKSVGQVLQQFFKYHILPVNSCGYYNFQLEIGAATNRVFNIEIARKA